MQADKPILICEYCTEQITTNHYTYKWFIEQHIMKPVHNYHLIFGKGRNDEREQETAEVRET